jgi:threonine dehydrogenase-like Zn-dependent dehydrogenase
MQALCWNGVNNLKTETVPDPAIKHSRDVIVKVTLSSVCGSDLPFIHGILPQ